MRLRRALFQYAAQSMSFNAQNGETFVVHFSTSVTNLRINNVSPGMLYCFILIQDGKGGHALAWPAQVRNPMMLDPTPNAVTVQCCVALSGGILQTITPGTWTEAAS